MGIPESLHKIWIKIWSPECIRPDKEASGMECGRKIKTRILCRPRLKHLYLIYLGVFRDLRN